MAPEGWGLWFRRGGAADQRGREGAYCALFPPGPLLLSKRVCLEGTLFSNSQKGTLWALGCLGENRLVKAFF